MPLSPKQCLVITWEGPEGYDAAPPIAVEELNRRHRSLSDQHIIVQSNTTKPYWFEEFDLPDDAWKSSKE